MARVWSGVQAKVHPQGSRDQPPHVRWWPRVRPLWKGLQDTQQPPESRVHLPETSGGLLMVVNTGISLTLST